MAESYCEEASDYGRRENCFIDHQGPPFNFLICAALLPNYPSKTDVSGLLPQHGLKIATLPRPRIDLEDDFLDNSLANGTCLASLIEAISPPPWPALEIVRKEDFTLEVPLLRSDANRDLQEYFAEVQSQRYPSMASIWLPLISLDMEKDEGLDFPRYSDRVQLFVQRELENESIEAIDDDSVIRNDYLGGCFSALTGCEIHTSTRPTPLTPPLSPMSIHDETPQTYEPEAEICVIDLTSEPSSPVRSEVLRIQAYEETDLIDDDTHDSAVKKHLSPYYPSTFQQTECYVDSRGLKVDVPILATSSVANSEQDITPGRDWGQLEADVSNTIFEETESFFDQALEVTLEEHHSHTDLVVEQEQLDPTNTVARLPVPLRDFSISPPPWYGHHTSQRSLFTWMYETSSECFALPLLPRNIRMESELRWTPLPGGRGRIETQETLDGFNGLIDKAPELSGLPVINSEVFVKTNLLPKIWKEVEEQELDDTVTQDDEISPRPNVSVSNNFTATLTPTNVGSSEMFWGSLRSSSSTLEAGTFSALPLGNDSGATSKLIQRFMELRSAKRPRLTYVDNRDSVRLSQNKQVPRNRVLEQRVTQVEPSDDDNLLPALSPNFEVPSEKANYLISLNMGRSIITHIESVWPRECLIDRDYSDHNCICWSPGSTQRKEVISPLSFEADLTLTPTVGIIMTNLLQVKQRPLPGSGALPQLRVKIVEASRLYETLIILVSELNPRGEHTGKPSESDMAAYADFVRFNMALREDVRTYFVCGADQTLAKWLLSLMCQYSPNALATGWAPKARESSWESFLRRCGMNVLAAQIVAASLLKDFGAEGLARFLGMTVQERLSRYATLLGGRKAILKVSQVIDGHWA